jgi:thioesterase domain-containing protein
VAPPRDVLEQTLVHIWQEVLDLSPIGVHDDFFDLGGHSLTAAAMVARAGAAFGRDVPLSLLLENSTLSQFAAALVKTARETAGEVFAVRADGARPPFFFLHGDFNGGGLYCASLARGLKSQPLYALAPLGADGRSAPSSIEAMAAWHAAAIRRVHPKGPYLLGGHCNGALEALEIARQFRAEGDEVPALVLIQPAAIDRRRKIADALVRLTAHMTALDDERRVEMALGLSEALRQMPWKPGATIRAGRRTIRTVLKRPPASPMVHSTPASTTASIPLVRHDDAVWNRYARAEAAYAPRWYGGSAAVFVGDEIVNTPDDPTPGWRRVGPRIEFHIVRGGHLSCISTHVAATASTIDAYIEQALR